MTLLDDAVGDSERSAALDGWVAAFDREMEQSGDFAASIAAMTAHGCFDVRAVVERWVTANPSGEAVIRHVEPPPPEPASLRLVPDVAPAVDEEAGAALQEPEVAPGPARTSRAPGAASSPDIAYFRSLLQGGIERAQIEEAFPGFELVIDEAVGQHEADAEPILSEVPPPPTREDLNDEIRGMRQRLQESATRGRRRWRTRS